MSDKSSIEFMVKEAANELHRQVIEAMACPITPRTPKIGVLDALEPLIMAIAKLQIERSIVDAEILQLQITTNRNTRSRDCPQLRMKKNK